MDAIGAATWLAVGYGLFLLAVAHGLDALAHRISSSALAREANGFSYHPDHDAWLCPQDQWLWPESFDAGNRVMRYRGSPAVCNACPVKDSCTSSGNGRQISRNIDPWPGSEAERFHRGIACSLVVLALVWPLATAVSVRSPVELVLLAGTVLLIIAGGLPLFSHFRRTPAAFPDHVPVQDLDENVAAQRAGSERSARRRAHYASDRNRAAGGTGEPNTGRTPLPQPRLLPISPGHAPRAALTAVPQPGRERFAALWEASNTETGEPAGIGGTASAGRPRRKGKAQ